MACIYIINGKKFKSLDNKAIGELLKAKLIMENTPKTLAMAYVAAKEDNTNIDFVNAVENQLTNKQNDKENGTGVQSNIGEGKEPIKTQPNENGGTEKISPSGNVQASEEEVVKPIAATEEAEFTPSAKDIKAFEKILETTSGAIRNKNIAEAVKVNPKIQEIMDNFEDLKKQLMDSVELTEDCSW